MENELRKLFVKVYARGYDECNQGLKIEEIDEKHRQEADELVNEGLALFERMANEQKKELIEKLNKVRGIGQPPKDITDDLKSGWFLGKIDGIDKAIELIEGKESK